MSHDGGNTPYPGFSHALIAEKLHAGQISQAILPRLWGVLLKKLILA